MMECYFKISCPCCPGSGSNSYSIESMEAKARSEQINRDIKKEAKRVKKQVKLLLLGAGESGKTTFLKQMRILHGSGFTAEDLLEYRRVVFNNVVQGMRVLCDARSKLSIPFQHSSNEANSNLILSLPRMVYLDQALFQGLVESIKSLWEDSGIKTTFSKSHLFQLPNSVGYFCDELERIREGSYIPSVLDVLNARSATKGVSELNVLVQNIPFQFIDVGGQRSQRDKWMQCFDNITSILFMVASSEFDQVLLEDRTTNRLKEAMTIFDVIINNRIFSTTAIIIFLNKCDLLEEKIRSSNLSDHFDYSGDNRDLEQVKKYILNLFLGLKREESGGPNLYNHYTIAIDTENIRLIFNDVKKIILKKNLEMMMLQ